MATDGSQAPPAAYGGTPAQVEDAWFDAPVCRDCGAPMHGAYCARCGQKRTARLAWGDLRREGWERWRLFEFASARTLLQLAVRPGAVARDYVLGRRKRHAHPLKLLLVLVALMVLMIATNGFFDHHAFSRRQDPAMARMAELVQAWANWSFSLGILAVFAASYTVFHRRLGYNAIEHAVLAVYCQCAVMAALLLGLLPTLAWDSPDAIVRYKQVFGGAMTVVKLAIVGVALHQFFLLDLRRQWWRLLLALAVYGAASWLLLRAYAYLVLQFVLRQAA